MPGKRYPKDTKARALAAASASGSDEASSIAGVPARTIRRWVVELETIDDSELEMLISAKKRVMSGLWAVLGVDALEFVQELRAAGDAKGMLAATTAAGICSTKLELLGQPKNVTQQSSGTANPLIVTPPDKGV